jgi:tetratricopeptide (TPR) repeat protein
MRAGWWHGVGLLIALAGGPALPAQAVTRDSALLATATAVAARATPEAFREAIGLRREAAALARARGDRRREATALAWIGDAWYQLGQPDSARWYALQAYPLRAATGDTIGVVRLLSGLVGQSYELEGQYDSAVAVYHRARALARATGDAGLEARTTQNLGSLYLDRSQPDSAFVWMRVTLDLVRQAGDRRSEGETLNNLAINFENLGQLDSALAAAHAAWRIAGELGSDSLGAPVLLTLGNAFTNLGQLDSALHYYRASNSAAVRAPLPSRVRASLQQIGTALLYLNQPDSAITYYREVIRLSREANDRSGEGSALSNLATLFLNQQQLDSAEVYYRRVLEIYQPLGYARGVAIATVNLAGVHVYQRRTDSALAYGHAGLEMSRQLEFPSLESVALNIIATVYQDAGQLDSALVYYRADLEVSRRIADVRGEGISLMSLGVLLDSRKDFAGAAAYFDSAAVVKGRLALHAGGDFNRTTLGEKEFELFEGWMHSWLRRTPEVGRAKAVLGALGATERGRAQALLDLMDRTADSTARGRDVAAWAAELVASATREGVSLLVYHLAQDTLVAWTATAREPLRAFEIPISRDSLSALVLSLRDRLGVEAGGSRLDIRGEPLERSSGTGSAGGSGSWEPVAGVLSNVLLPASVRAALAGTRELLLVPHGIVALVPFDLLPWGPRGRLVATRLALRYAPSVATAVSAEARPRPPRDAALVVGNPTMPVVTSSTGDTLTLAALPGAEREARSVAGRLQVTALVGSLATETAVREQLGRAPVVHLATHGFAFGTEGLARRSFVALAPDSLGDGILSVGELLDDPTLSLRADLVILSACQTGLGDLKRAEGTIGLQRAFLGKGARSVLVSLWNVSDEATSLLMQRFYAHWLGDRDSPSKSEALRRAVTDVRASREFSHPRYWAGFQLVGAR